MVVLRHPERDRAEHITVSKPTFLSLPFELRSQIYSYLICCDESLVIRSLFIRERYRNIFMTQAIKDICTPLLRVCRQIHNEALPILYSRPMWKCGCRLDGLASQIGFQNFGRILKMNVDFDDIEMISENLEFSKFQQNSNLSQQLRFDNLEVLEAAGFQMGALVISGTKTAQLEAIKLCELAQRIIKIHPKLKVLAQDNTLHNGGSDAVDITFGRVRWRFLAQNRSLEANEHAVDLPSLITNIRRAFDSNPNAMGRRLSEYEFAIQRKFGQLT